MRKHDSIKKTLLISVLSVVLCISMFIGTTYAWFRDEISYKGTRIQTGTLDAELLVYDQEKGQYVSTEGVNIFAAYANDPIVPGEIQVVYLQVKNVGKYAMDYNVKVGIFGSKDSIGEGESAETANPASILEYAVLSGLDAATGLDSKLDWSNIVGQAKSASGSVSTGDPVEIFAKKVTLEAPRDNKESVQYFALAICIPESAADAFATYQGTSIENLGVQVVAEQVGATAVDAEDTADAEQDSTDSTD